MAEISSYFRGETEASGKPFSGSQPSKSEQEHSGNRQEIIKITQNGNNVYHRRRNSRTSEPD